MYDRPILQTGCLINIGDEQTSSTETNMFVIYLVIGLVFVSDTAKTAAYGQGSYSARLVGGNDAQGRLEVVNNATTDGWYAVCNDNFTDISAGVACRSLGKGFTEGIPINNEYGNGDNKFAMLDVRCTGYESTLFECPHKALSSYFCFSGFVAIRCQEALRLETTVNAVSGLLAILQDGEWGTVCDNGFDDTDAEVACRSLGLGYYYGIKVDPTRAENISILIEEVECSDYNATFADCPQIKRTNSSNCTNSAQISCNKITDDKLDLVVDGENKQEGRLMVRHNGVWGTICNKEFDDIDASAACLTLGLGATGEVINGTQSPETAQIWFEDVRCSQKDQCFLTCKHSAWMKPQDCTHDDDVYIRCTKAPGDDNAKCKNYGGSGGGGGGGSTGSGGPAAATRAVVGLSVTSVVVVLSFITALSTTSS